MTDSPFYSPELEARAVRLVLTEDRPVSSVARDLGLRARRVENLYQSERDRCWTSCRSTPRKAPDPRESTLDDFVEDRLTKALLDTGGDVLRRWPRMRANVLTGLACGAISFDMMCRMHAAMTINGWGGQSSPRRRQRLASEIFDYFATPDDDKEDMQEQKEVMLGYASQLALHPQALSAGLVTIANALNLMVPKALRVRIRISEREDDGLGQEWHGQMLRRYHCLPAPGNNLVRDAARRYKFMAGLNAAMLKQGTLDPASSKLARQDQVKYSEFHDTLMSSSNLSDGEEWLFQLASRLLETLCPLAELVGETRARQIVQLGRQLANETGKIQCHIGVDPILRFCGNFSREVASLIEFGRSDVAATIFMATVRFCDVKEVQMRLNALRCVQNSGLDWREMKRVQDTSMNDFKAWSTALSRIIGPAEIDSDLREKLFQAALKLLSRIEPEIWHRAKLTGPRIVRLANGLASLKIKGREKRNHPTFVDELFADPASLENDASSLVSALQQVVEVSRPNSGES